MKLKNDGNENITTETKLDSTNTQWKNIDKNTNHNDFYVYALIHPTTNLPFYIGKGRNNRDKSHISETKNNKIPHGNRHLFYTIKNIINNGLEVVIKHLDSNLSEHNAFLKENEYIKKYGRRDLGTGILTNLTDGGEGQSGWHPSEEYKNKMSISTSGNKNGMYGKKHTSETKELIRKKAIGRKHTELVKKNKSIKMMGENNHFYGKKHTDEVRSKIRENSIKTARYGKDNHGYIDLDSVKDLIITEYNKKTTISEITRMVNKSEIRCSRMAIRLRLKKWITDKHD